VFQLRIALEGVDPPVWRRLLVPGSVRLGRLHGIFQVAMGWDDSHLHRFRIDGDVYGGGFFGDEEGEIDGAKVSVGQALQGHWHFFYDYDFGDAWIHVVDVEDLRGLPLGLKFAVCLGGENACPPEDCGGTGGYASLLAAVEDSSHDEHECLLEWVGGGFDPARFDVAEINAALQHVCRDAERRTDGVAAAADVGTVSATCNSQELDRPSSRRASMHSRRWVPLVRRRPELPAARGDGWESVGNLRGATAVVWVDWLDDGPDVSCLDGSRGHWLDVLLGSLKVAARVRIPLGLPIAAGQGHPPGWLSAFRHSGWRAVIGRPTPWPSRRSGRRARSDRTCR
jgi:hypothetical protein